MLCDIKTLARGKEVQNPADPQWIKQHTWIAKELGANVIKTAMPAASRACAKR